jgi:hypothetical protein
MVEIAAPHTLGRKGAHTTHNSQHERRNRIRPQPGAPDGGEVFFAQSGYHELVDKLHDDEREHSQDDGECQT